MSACNARIEGLEGQYPEQIWFHPDVNEPERHGYVRMDRYLELLSAVLAAKRLCDNVNEFGGVTDSVILDSTDATIRKALDAVYAKVLTAGVEH